jgi:ribonuclease P protein component
MLPKKNKLTKGEVPRLFSCPVISRNQFFVMRGEEGDRLRAAVVISKKVAARAVDRNRMRRRLYAALRSSQDGTTKGYTLVLQSTKLTLSAPFSELITACNKAIIRG